MTKFYESWVFTLRQARHNYGTESTVTRNHATLYRLQVDVTSEWPDLTSESPGTGPAFFGPTGTRPAICGDFWGSFGGLKAV